MIYSSTPNPNSIYITRDLYLALKGQLEEYVPTIKNNIYLWNNQFEHSNGDKANGKNEAAFQYPALFLEFNNFVFRQLSMGVLEFDYNLITHLGYKSLLKEDLRVYDILEQVYYICERFQGGSFGRITRVSEDWSTSHDQAQVITTTYKGYSKDYNRFVFNDCSTLTLTGMTITSSLSLTGVTQTNNWSGSTDNNGNNQYINPNTNNNNNW